MKHYIPIFILTLLAASCEKPIFDEDKAASGSVADTHPNVTLHFSPYEQSSFTRAATPLTDQCTRLSVAIFTSDGTKAKAITQKQTDAGFGTAALTLQAGTYKIVAIAHSSTEGNATITSTEKVTFANNKLTDTFYYFGTLTVGTDPIEETLEMTRCVAMLRLTLTEPLPDDITRMKFYYTGGSSTFSPATGYGCVNSKQTEYRYTTDDQDMPVTVYELYTMPHEQQDVLKLTVTALDASGSEVGEVVMDNIPVTRNKITTWQGALFSGSGSEGGTSSSGGISIILDTEWDGTITYTF
jgi:hypothetical protein